MLFDALLRQEFKISKDRDFIFSILHSVFRWRLTMPSNGLLSLSLIYCLYSWCCSSEHYLCPLLPEHSSSSCPASPQVLQRCSSAGQSMACAAGVHLFPHPGLSTFPFWVSGGSCWLIPAFVLVFLDSSSALGPPGLVSFANPVTTHSIPSSKALVKMLNRSGRGRPTHSSSAYRQLGSLPWQPD